MKCRQGCWALLFGAGVVVLGWADYMTGYELNFVLFYFLPVSLAAWFSGLGCAVSLSVLSAMVWYTADYESGHVYSTPFISVWNATVRLVSFLVIAWTMFKLRQLLDRERNTTAELRRAISEVKTLEAFLPICATCKKIRDDQGAWQQIEAYISTHADVKFSHGYCPECAGKLLKEAGLSEDKEALY